MMKRLDFSKPHILRNEEEYDAAVAEMDALLDRNPSQGSPEHDRLEFLSVLVEAYDEERHSMGSTATPQAVVAFLLDQQGMSLAGAAECPSSLRESGGCRSLKSRSSASS